MTYSILCAKRSTLEVKDGAVDVAGMKRLYVVRGKQCILQGYGFAPSCIQY